MEVWNGILNTISTRSRLVYRSERRFQIFNSGIRGVSKRYGITSIPQKKRFYFDYKCKRGCIIFSKNERPLFFVFVTAFDFRLLQLYRYLFHFDRCLPGLDLIFILYRFRLFPYLYSKEFALKINRGEHLVPEGINRITTR